MPKALKRSLTAKFIETSDDDLKPSAKLTEAMYEILQSELPEDNVTKQKAEQIDLPSPPSTIIFVSAKGI